MLLVLPFCISKLQAALDEAMKQKEKDYYKIQGHKKCNKCKLYTWCGEDSVCVNIRCQLNKWIVEQAMNNESAASGSGGPTPKPDPEDNAWRFEWFPTQQFGQDFVTPKPKAKQMPVHLGSPALDPPAEAPVVDLVEDEDEKDEDGGNEEEEQYRKEQAALGAQASRGMKRKADV